MSNIDLNKGHVRFTVEETSLFRMNASREAALAVYYQAPPKKVDGGTAHSLRFPVLIVPDIVSDKKAFAQQVADLLNEHWEEAE